MHLLGADALNRAASLLCDTDSVYFEMELILATLGHRKQTCAFFLQLCGTTIFKLTFMRTFTPNASSKMPSFNCVCALPFPFPLDLTWLRECLYLSALELPPSVCVIKALAYKQVNLEDHYFLT